MDTLKAFLKPLTPLLAAVYGGVLISVTALPLGGNAPGIGGELLSWVLTMLSIVLTLFLVSKVEPKVFPAARQFSLKSPKPSVIVGLLLIAPLWLVTKEYVVYGLTSLVRTVQMEPLTYTSSELREDLLSSVHAVLLAPVLEELCFRQMAISPFRRRGTQIAVCVVMALLFGIPHVRNFYGAFLSAMFYGLVFIWTRNIWYGVALHAGSNLMGTLLMVYCWMGLGSIQMAKMPVIALPDIKVFIASVFLAIAGVFLIQSKGRTARN